MSLVHPLVNGIARESGTHDHQGYETDTKWEDLPILPSRPWIYNWIEYIVSVKGPINWANILFCAHWSRYLVVTLCISSLPKNEHPSVWLLSPRKELKRKLGNTSIAPSIASACQFSNLPSQKKKGRNSWKLDRITLTGLKHHKVGIRPTWTPHFLDQKQQSTYN